MAQAGATIGREFSYALLRAVTHVEEVALRQGLARLVQAEIVYQRGVPPQASISLNTHSFRMLPISPC